MKRLTRSQAAKLGWRRRRARAAKWSAAAKKGWVTRRAKAPAKAKKVGYLRALLRSLPPRAKCAAVAKNGADLSQFGYAGTPHELEAILDGWGEKYGDANKGNYIENWLGGIKIFLR